MPTFGHSRRTSRHASQQNLPEISEKYFMSDPDDVQSPTTKSRRPSFKRAISLIADGSSRSSRTATETSQPTIIQFKPRKTWSQSKHSKRSSFQEPEPALQYYQDPEARKKLKHLASPENFDEALMHGFPTSPPMVEFQPIKYQPEDSLETLPASTYWPSPKPTAGAIPRASNDAHRFLRHNTLSWLDNEVDDDAGDDGDDPDSEFDGDDLYDDYNRSSVDRGDEQYYSPAEPDSPITPRDYPFSVADSGSFSPTETIASLYTAEDPSSTEQNGIAFPAPPSRSNTVAPRVYDTADDAPRDTNTVPRTFRDDDAAHVAFQTFHPNLSDNSTVPPTPPPKDTPKKLSIAPLPPLAAPQPEVPAEQSPERPQQRRITLPKTREAAYSREPSRSRRPSATATSAQPSSPPWPGAREMTMRMTLTRPELRAPEEQIYRAGGLGVGRGSASAPVNPFCASGGPNPFKGEAKRERERKSAARQPLSLQELPEAWEADAGCWASVGTGRALRMSAGRLDGGASVGRAREKNGENGAVKKEEKVDRDAGAEGHRDSGGGASRKVWRKMSLGGMRR